MGFLDDGAGLAETGFNPDSWQAAAHGATGGVIADLQGGKFAHGFLSAAANKAVHSRLPTDMHPALGGMVSAIVGGTVSEVSGGKFANGAITAAMAYAFNQRLSGRSASEQSDCPECDEVRATRRGIIDKWQETVAEAGTEAAKELGTYAAGGVLGKVVGKGIGAARGTAAVGGQGFHSHSALTRALGPAGPNRHWHHVVEQTPGNIARFGAQSIHNTQNVIRLDAGVHRQISGFYSSIQPQVTGSTSMTVRQWLGTQSFDAQ